MPVEAIAGKILSEQGELTAVVTILHDRREALEKARLYEQLKQASDELERKVQEATAELAQQNELLRRQAHRARAGVGAQVAVPREHVARVPDAAERDPRLHAHAAAGRGRARRPTRSASSLARIDSNGRHLLTIINDILDISRIEAGRMPLQSRDVRHPGAGRARCMSELEPIIVRSKLAVTREHARATLPPLTSDRQKVKQIVLNLLSNALKFTPQGSVTISARRTTRRSRTVGIAVRRHRHRHRAERSGRSLRRLPAGRQLADARLRRHRPRPVDLPPSRADARRHASRSRATSGKGSTFTLTLAGPRTRRR